MADPTLVLTYSDMQIRVAEFLGIAYYGAAGTSAAAVPVDAHDLDVVERIVNDGYRRFLGEKEWSWNHPLLSILFREQTDGTVDSATTTTLVDATLGTLAAGKGGTDDDFNGFTVRVVSATTGEIQTAVITDYTASTGTLIVASWPGFTPVASDSFSLAPATCVGGQNHRYFLPDDFSGNIDNYWSYEETGAYSSIREVAEYRIRELRAGGAFTGLPIFVAVMPVTDVSVTTDGKRWEAIFYPAPNVLKTVQARYRRIPAQLSSGTDKHIAGPQHDVTILAAVMAEAEMQREDVEGSKEVAYQKALSRSLSIDARASQASIGQNSDHSDEFSDPRSRRGFSVGTFGGTVIDDP